MGHKQLDKYTQPRYRYRNDLTYEEVNSFYATIGSEERMEALKPGECMPAIILTPDKYHAMLTWQKGDGSISMIEIQSKVDEDGEKVCTNLVMRKL